MGKVYLVGAGPGDPELLTLKAKAILERADVVFYDALISPEILALMPKTALRIHAGKRRGRHSLSQPAQLNDASIFPNGALSNPWDNLSLKILCEFGSLAWH